MVTVRQLRETDVEAFVTFREKASRQSNYTNSITKERASLLLEEKKDELAFGVFEKETLVACVILSEKSELHIDSIAVLQETRGKGYGKELLRKTESVAEKKKYSSVSLSVHKNNSPAIALYEKSGYKLVNQGKRNLVFKKDLVSNKKNLPPTWSKW